MLISDVTLRQDGEVIWSEDVRSDLKNGLEVLWSTELENLISSRYENICIVSHS